MIGRRLSIIGAGGVAREVAEAARKSNWVIDANYVEAAFVGHKPGAQDMAQLPDHTHLICAIADPAARERIMCQFPLKRFADIIHPTAITNVLAWLGWPDEDGHGRSTGRYIGAGCILSPGVRIGTGAQIHNGAIIGHDSFLQDFATVLPGAIISGNCTIERGALIGAGAKIKEGVTIGAGAIVGMGAVVLRQVIAGEMAVGVPAKIVDHKTP